MHNFTDLTKQKWKQRNYIIKKKNKKNLTFKFILCLYPNLLFTAKSSSSTTPSHKNPNILQNFYPIQLQKLNKTPFQENPISSKSNFFRKSLFNSASALQIKPHLHSSRVEQNKYSG